MQIKTFKRGSGESVNMATLTVEDIKQHFRDKLNDIDNEKRSRDLYALQEIERLEKSLIKKEDD